MELRVSPACKVALRRPSGCSLFALIQSAIILSGCVPSSEMPDLMMGIPATYRQDGPGERKNLPPDEWWRDFRSSELNGFMSEVPTGNFDVAAAIARIVQADAAAHIAGTALLPTMTANDTVTRSKFANLNNTNVNSVTSNASNTARTVIVTNLQASYILDLWGMNRAKLQAAEETSNYNRWERDVVALTAYGTTGTTYLAVLGARDRINNQNDNLKAASRILKLIQDRVKFGTANALNLAQQEALVANIRAAIPPLQLTGDQNLVALGLLVGRVPESIVIKGNSLHDVTMPKIAPGLPSEVLTQRPDVQAAEAQLASAHASVVAARAAFFPQIQLTGEGGFQSLALKTLFQPSAGLYSLAAGLTQPIFDAGLLQGDYDQAKARQEELLADYRKSIVSAFTDVEKALISIRNLRRQEVLLGESLAASQRALDLAEDQLRAGTVDYTTVLQAQQTLFTTRDTLSQTRLALLQAGVALYQALGGGWPQSQAPAQNSQRDGRGMEKKAAEHETKTAQAEPRETVGAKP
nr:efflux transporter outer membrane subunit [Beijerinckia indica]